MFISYVEFIHPNSVNIQLSRYSQWQMNKTGRKSDFSLLQSELQSLSGFSLRITAGEWIVELQLGKGTESKEQKWGMQGGREWWTKGRVLVLIDGSSSPRHTDPSAGLSLPPWARPHGPAAIKQICQTAFDSGYL